MTKLPSPSKVAPLHLRLEEKGTAVSSFHLRSLPNAFRSMSAVTFSSWSAPMSSEMACSAQPSGTCSSLSSVSKDRVPSVIVPVLSRQITSTRASVSILSSDCTSALLRARFRALTVSVIPVSRISPSGIMPSMAADAPSTAL